MRFALLCRVSSEEQTKGESISVQVKTLRKCVSLLNGEIIREYVGQESAMGVKERPILEEMLSDCNKSLFDCLMVYDLSRLSRDPVKSKIILGTFRKNNIRLFIQSQEFNLNNPETSLIAGILSEINHFSVQIQTQKAMASRIELARRGFPLSTLPHGRRLVSNDKSKNAIYEVIPEAKEEAKKFWELYVNQKRELRKIADQFNTNVEFVRRVLLEYSSSEWKQMVHYDGRTEIIITPVPPLLSDEQIEKAKIVSKTNKSFNRRIYDYILSGRIRCELCKMTYYGRTNIRPSKIHRYYSHSDNFRTELCIKSVKGELIESAVFMSINNLFSDLNNLKECITNALSVNKKQEEIISKKIDECKKELERLSREQNNLIHLAKKGVLTESEISKEISKIREDTLENEERLKYLNSQLNSIRLPVPDDLPERIHRFYLQLIGKQGSIPDVWSLESKKLLLDWFFGSSKDTGIFIAKDPQKSIVFNVRGVFNASYLGIMEKEIDSIQIIGFQELENDTLTKNIVDFGVLIQTLVLDPAVSGVVDTHTTCYA